MSSIVIRPAETRRAPPAPPDSEQHRAPRDAARRRTAESSAGRPAAWPDRRRRSGRWWRRRRSDPPAARQRTIDERQIHRPRRRGEAQTVVRGQARIAIATLQELVAEAGPPRRRASLPRRRWCAARTGAHRRRARGSRTCSRSPAAAAASARLGVALANALEDAGRIGLDGILEDSGVGGAGVLDVGVDVAGAQRPVADERAAQVQPALDRERASASRSSAPESRPG